MASRKSSELFVLNVLLITLLLALTDQFGHAADAHHRARASLAALESEYDKAYYAGIIAERRAKAQLAHGGPGSSVGAYDWIAWPQALGKRSRHWLGRRRRRRLDGKNGRPAVARV